MKFGDFRRNFRQLGARSACWVLPGESLPSSAGGGEPWVPCPHGGLAFSYAEDPQQKHARDKIFEVTGGSVSAGDHASFGEHGGWVRVYPIELRPTLTDLSGKQPPARLSPASGLAFFHDHWKECQQSLRGQARPTAATPCRRSTPARSVPTPPRSRAAPSPAASLPSPRHEILTAI